MDSVGGILGGMTNGMPIIFRVAIKPTPSIGIEQDTVDSEEKKNIKYQIKGWHDPAREKQLLSEISQLAGSEFSDYSKVLYNTILSLSKSYQSSLLGENSESTHSCHIMQKKLYQDTVLMAILKL